MRDSVPTTPDRLKPAAFIDRDGVINAELDYVHRVDDFHVLPGVVEALKLLRDKGYELVVVTNQAGIAHGYYGVSDFQRLTDHMLGMFAAQGVPIAGVYYCPHHPKGQVAQFRIDCECRKPAAGMLLAAAKDLGLDLGGSVLVGDKTSDTQAGRAAGVRRTVLVRSGHVLPADAALHADLVCDDLLQAAHAL